MVVVQMTMHDVYFVFPTKSWEQAHVIPCIEGVHTPVQEQSLDYRDLTLTQFFFKRIARATSHKDRMAHLNLLSSNRS